mmetsp:Transcript_27706/g.51662  ORF Transcript_27706/g.51662 Transcript_27706/m.51662 type:complete len:273 (+) Transcript_27706:1483-2301(+)
MLKTKIINTIMIIMFFYKNKNILLISVDFYIYYFILKINKSTTFKILKFLTSYKKNNFCLHDGDIYNSTSCQHPINVKNNIKNQSNTRKRNYKNLVNNLFWVNSKFLLYKSNALNFFFKFDIVSKYKINFNYSTKINIKNKILTKNFKKFLIQLIWYLNTQKCKNEVLLITKPLITRQFLNFYIILNYGEVKWCKNKILRWIFEILYRKLLYENIVVSSAIILEIMVLFSRNFIKNFDIFKKWSWGVFYILHKKWFEIEIFNNILRIIILNF